MGSNKTVSKRFQVVGPTLIAVGLGALKND